jgi:methylated-DNA-[protein]-cysteine S-methyltransferase
LKYTAVFTLSGWIGILSSETGITRMSLPQPDCQKALDSLGKLEYASREDHFFARLACKLVSYFGSTNVAFDEKLDLAGYTPFPASSMAPNQKIPYGTTASYADIGRSIGKPGAARAVGQALKRNPVPIIIPCHRVVHSNGTTGGFSGGDDIKLKLLALERDGLNPAIK